MERWIGKVALVTGASSGIGAATAIELVKRGLKVVAVARREEKVQALQSQLKGAKGTLYPRKADISKEGDIVAQFQWIKQTFGAIHVLINNAGVTRYGKYVEQNPQYWREIFDLNVIGLSICTQQAVKLMRESGVNDGHIIHINSVLGHIVPSVPDPIFGIYPASGFAITALTETLRQELRFFKTKIRVTSISPGIVRTGLGDAANAAMEERERFNRMEKLKTGQEEIPILEPQDVVDGIVYCLSTPPHVQVHELSINPLGSEL